jgi:hypothetical protein
MAYNVFISHSYLDRDLGARVADFVRSSGARVIDWSLDSENQITSEITERLRRSNEMIVLVTSHSATNPWLHWEIGLAAGLEKKITPVMEGVHPVDIPPPLNNLQAVSVTGIEQLRQGLTERMASKAKRPPRLTKARPAIHRPANREIA